VVGGLPGDEESAPDLAWVEPLDVVEQLHDFELRERDAELKQRSGEASAQDPVDASFGVDQPTGVGSLPLHDVFISWGGDTASRTHLKAAEEAWALRSALCIPETCVTPRSGWLCDRG
jgi:hypothetical protein